MIQQYKNLRIGLSIIGIITYVISHMYYKFPFGSMMDMQVLMGVRFFVFGVMKLLDIRGFADLFRQYDPLAKYVYGYGLCYPFLEIVLGITYLRDMQMNYRLPTNIVATIITAITSLGIIYKLYQGTSMQCACMGSKIKTPLGRPSLIEQFGMCIMAIWMISMMI